MRITIGIVLIVVSSILFTVLLSENTPWILGTSYLFVIGFGFVCSKIHEMEDDILFLNAKLNDFIRKGNEKEKNEK